MNEVLATALGNGYVFENLNKARDTGTWYNWRYIDLMAKQVYPVISDYIKGKKAIDKNFVDAYIKLYEQNYSGWINEPDHVMTYRFVLSENRQDFRSFRALYPYCTSYEAATPVSEASIERIKETPLTKIIIVSKSHAVQLSLIKRKFPELKTWKYKADEEFNFNIFLNDKTQLYIINQHETPTDVLIKRLEQPGK
ncbi:hypothetical protein KK083_07535 [Fulvivirgaceae bacterium PWU4]|uniref:Uncharacterized protein n=1 Tax=Chryseosolibacter histidini TaxID=2782349 RepID=A0AAP2DID0_9BACT|nr:hypothetical protein [Chryseosolibacter histidini]MBT1696720.1 hypothetical protein [Chryseosolibacter histidini]